MATIVETPHITPRPVWLAGLASTLPGLGLLLLGQPFLALAACVVVTTAILALIANPSVLLWLALGLVWNIQTAWAVFLAQQVAGRAGGLPRKRSVLNRLLFQFASRDGLYTMLAAIALALVFIVALVLVETQPGLKGTGSALLYVVLVPAVLILIGWSFVLEGLYHYLSGPDQPWYRRIYWAVCIFAGLLDAMGGWWLAGNALLKPYL